MTKLFTYNLCSNDMFFLALVESSDALYSDVIRFCSSTRENDLPRVCSNQICYLLENKLKENLLLNLTATSHLNYLKAVLVYVAFFINTLFEQMFPSSILVFLYSYFIMHELLNQM